MPVTQATRGQTGSTLGFFCIIFYSIAYVKMNMTVIFSLFSPLSPPQLIPKDHEKLSGTIGFM